MNDERRPKAAHGSTAKRSTASIPVADIPAQLRRRRAASYRLPLLDCGRRDPLDPAGWSSRLEARRLTWCHLQRLGLLDEHIDATLRGAA